MRRKSLAHGGLVAWGLMALMALTPIGHASASDHLDAPTVIAEPQGDIGDIYAWISADGKKLNLVMTIFGKSFSPQLDYKFHIDSGQKFGSATTTVDFGCRIVAADRADCALGSFDRAVGNASAPVGLRSERQSFRVFAGLRDDPFFNNVRGTRDMYNSASAAISSGAPIDGQGCPRFDPATSRDLLDRWGRTDGGPGRNFLAGWPVAALVASIDVKRVSKGGKLLAIWATTTGPNGGIDRMGRPLTGNALLATLGPVDLGNRLKEEYNRASPSSDGGFVAEIARGLSFYDGIDGRCGNQWLADPAPDSPDRYGRLAALLADDRLWIDTRGRRCTSLFAVERHALSGDAALSKDCGGRTLAVDAADIYRSFLVDGTETGVDDGVRTDEAAVSPDIFPFLSEAVEAEP